MFIAMTSCNDQIRSQQKVPKQMVLNLSNNNDNPSIK